MRLPTYRDFQLGRKDPIKPPDGRGRHSKRRAEQWLKENQHLIIPDPLYHRPCGCDPFASPTIESGSGLTCTGCGLVFREQCFVYESHVVSDGPGEQRRDYHTLMDLSSENSSAPYQRRHHYAEKIKLASNHDPRISNEDMEYILTQAYPTWPENDDTRLNTDLSPDDIQSLLEHAFPGDPHIVRKYRERWLQIKIALCGGTEAFADNVKPLMPQRVVYHLYHRFEEFANAFNYLKRFYKAFPRRKNIPYLNTVSRHLLFHGSAEDLHYYQWYFAELKTLWSRLKNEFMVCAILRFLERRNTSFHSYQWQYRCLLSKSDRALILKNKDRWRQRLRREFTRSQ